MTKTLCDYFTQLANQLRLEITYSERSYLDPSTAMCHIKGNHFIVQHVPSSDPSLEILTYSNKIVTASFVGRGECNLRYMVKAPYIDGQITMLRRSIHPLSSRVAEALRKCQKKKDLSQCDSYVADVLVASEEDITRFVFDHIIR